MKPRNPLICSLALWLIFATTYSRPTYEAEEQKEGRAERIRKEPCTDPVSCTYLSHQGTTATRAKTCMCNVLCILCALRTPRF